MKKEEMVTKETKTITDIICDSCGNSCDTDYGFEYMKLESNWGFSSNKDFERWTAEICEKCVDDKFKFITFKKDK